MLYDCKREVCDVEFWIFSLTVQDGQQELKCAIKNRKILLH